jgi:hypothetical protein
LRKYFYTDGKNKFGPYSIGALKSKKLEPNTLIWYFGLEEWTPYKNIVDLKESKADINTEKQRFGLTKTFQNVTFKQYTYAIYILIPIAIIGLFLLFRNSSKNEEIKNSIISSDEDFQMYVDKFYRDIEVNGISKIRPKKQIISLANLDQHIESNHIHAISLGKDKDDLIEIYINKTSWDNFNKAQKYYVMYHELSHDVLNLVDLEGLIENKGQLMYPSIDSYERLTMDEFIDSYQKVFEEYGKTN